VPVVKRGEDIQYVTIYPVVVDVVIVTVTEELNTLDNPFLGLKSLS